VIMSMNYRWMDVSGKGADNFIILFE
jgi:hypothetical protein